ncbi:hypothetical protein GGS24DRAFT_241351 [Hypoxylon argillaceum]|nr:hypothetical protein GGS24DRAFT_241351 [Hypoxylon argillaceum]
MQQVIPLLALCLCVRGLLLQAIPIVTDFNPSFWFRSERQHLRHRTKNLAHIFVTSCAIYHLPHAKNREEFLAFCMID